MKNRILSIGALTTALFALTSVLYLSKENQVYKPRAQQSQEPNNMAWAQMDLNTGEYNPFSRNIYGKMLSEKSSRDNSLGLEFAQRGPDNIGGRTRAIIELFGKPDTLFAGSVSGGLYVSYNGGGTWQQHEQFKNIHGDIPGSSIIASIHQDTISGNIYVGTGSSFDQFADTRGVHWPGYGIFVSDDEGETFTHIESTEPGDRYTTAGESWIAVNRIKTNSQGHIFAATEVGLMASYDDGETWENPVYIDPAATIPQIQPCADVAVGSDGKILVGYWGGVYYTSETGVDGSFEQINGTDLPSGGSRSVLDIAPSDPDVMYIMKIESSSACLEGVYKSVNGGDDWDKILAPFDEFTPFSRDGGSGCQGVYDAALTASPKNPDEIYIGGLTTWRFDGSLTRIASEGGGGGPFPFFDPTYVHADKHFFYFSPNNKNRMYVLSDGGIGVTSNRGTFWTTINKGYNTTQFYGIAHSTERNIFMGGAQDNGTLVVLGDNEFDPYVGYTLYGNDGIDCDMSQLMPIFFASSQNGLVARQDLSDAENQNGNPPTALVSEMNSGGPFNTVVKLWESIYDSTSQSVITFAVDPVQISIATGNGSLKTFNESVTPLQPAAIVITSSVFITSGDQTLELDDDEATLIGDGSGTVVFEADGSMTVSATFDEAPSENSAIKVGFQERYEANSVLYLESNNMRSQLGSYVFEYRLENDLNPGDELVVQDPAQSFLLSTGDDSGNPVGGSLRFYRNVLNAQDLPPTPYSISGLSGSVRSIEISKDGDVAYVGTGAGNSGALYRLSGLKNVYSQQAANQINVNQIFTSNAGPVTGIALDPMDNSRLVVTTGGYGQSNRVQFTANALAGNPSFTNVHANLPTVPIYDAEFNINSANMVLLGTEYGLWATADITSASPEWVDVNDDLSYVPIYDIRQQHLPWSEAKNTGMVYVGTHGRGLWMSESMVGTPEFGSIEPGESSISDFKVYPNPVQSEGKIEFISGFEGNVTLRIFDLNGRQVRTWQERVGRGTNTLSLTTMGLQSGSYFATIQADGVHEMSKFLVLK